MKQVVHFRREFLRRGSAALTVGGAMGVLGREALADTPVASGDSNGMLTF